MTLMTYLNNDWFLYIWSDVGYISRDLSNMFFNIFWRWLGFNIFANEISGEIEDIFNLSIYDFEDFFWMKIRKIYI